MEKKMSSKTIDEQMNESQIILDVIDAIKTDRPVRFDYGADIVREIKPVGFFGDYAGFEGVEAGDNTEFRRFRFDSIKEWIGIGLPTKIVVELEFADYPTDNDVKTKLYNTLTENKEIIWRVEECPHTI
jgi:predicted DNA-binding transcriptional regulator YafY|tara:strand:+ start:1784 stop:2170 length:387 start_codon:yes stop_codon:yes gene_type:complete